MKTSLNDSERKDLTRDNLEAAVEIRKPSTAPFIVGTINFTDLQVLLLTLLPQSNN